MSDQDTFPRQLLRRPVSERLAYFQQKVIAHPRLIEADQALLSAIQSPAEAGLIFVIGPTGVGKTTLRLRVEQRLTEALLPVLQQDKGRLPVVSIEVAPPETGAFNWKDYYKRVLTALNEPTELMAHKVARAGDAEHTRPCISRSEPLLFGANSSAADFRRALELCLSHRRPLALLLDEAQHFRKISGGRRLLDQMDILKSLASISHTLHVLFGTYELMDLTNLSAQLGRRSILIHFPRYRYDDADDLQMFKSVLHTFQRHVPVSQAPAWVADAEYLYERCGGCVGTLKGWLNRALALALQANDKTITQRHLERAIDPNRLMQMAYEINAGEAAWTEYRLHQHERRALLGMGRGVMAEPREPAMSSPANSTAQSTQYTLKGKRGRIGQRQPGRDRANGEVSHAAA